MLIAASTAQAAVWVNQRAWSADEEQQYSRWVRASWSKNFFSQKTLPGSSTVNPFYGNRVDCADTVYSMRFIYSFIRRLPFVISDPSGAGLISNTMKRFDSKASEDERAALMLKWLYDIVATDHMDADTFPVALNASAIRPGIVILTTHANHHSWTVKDILDTGVPWLVFNSRVGATSSIILQERKSWPHGAWVFEGDATLEGRAGFRDWRPAAYLNQPVWNVPGFSDEQYRVGPAQWSTVAMTALAQRRERPDEKLLRLMDAACGDLQQRVSAVQEGVSFLRSSGYACMDPATFDLYSTPSRDHRLFDSLADIRRAYISLLKSGATIGAGTLAKVAKIVPFPALSARDEMGKMNSSQQIDAKSVCVVEYAPGVRIDLAEAKRRMFAGRFSSNPHDDLDYRWGEKAGPSATALQCPSEKLWTPNVDEAN